MGHSLYLGIGVGVLALLTGCGGGGGGGSDDDGGGGNVATPGPSQSGLYQGTITLVDEEGNEGGTGSGIFLVSQNSDGTADFVNQAPGTYATGILDFNDDSFVGVIQQYKLGRPLPEGEFEGELQGTSTTESFTGESFNAAGKKLSSFDFNRQPQVSGIDAAFSAIDGSWTDIENATPLTNITIASNGELSGGGGGANCTFTGNVTIPDPQVNIYKISYTASNCAATSSTTFSPEEQAGVFEGYGFYKPASGSVEEQFVVLVDNDDISRYYILEK